MIDRHLVNQAVFLFLVLSLAVFIPGESVAKKVFKMGHPMTPTSSEGRALERFADLVNQKSNGEIEVQVFHSGQLGKTQEVVDGVMMGTTALTCESVEIYDKYLPVARIMGMPYYFKSREQMRKFLSSPTWKKEFMDPLKDLGITVLSTQWNWDRGPYRTLISREPVFVPEDLEGMKLRIYEVETLKKAWKAFGAVPIVITWSEAYLALRQGVADAITCPIGLLYTARFTEILKYVTITKQFPQTMLLGMNTKMFQDLSEDEQKVMMEAANETGGYFSELERERGEQGIEKMLTEHNAFFIRTNLEPWWLKAQSARKELEKSGFLPDGLWEKVNALE